MAKKQRKSGSGAKRRPVPSLNLRHARRVEERALGSLVGKVVVSLAHALWHEYRDLDRLPVAQLVADAVRNLDLPEALVWEAVDRLIAGGVVDLDEDRSFKLKEMREAEETRCKATVGLSVLSEETGIPVEHPHRSLVRDREIDADADLKASFATRYPEAHALRIGGPKGYETPGREPAFWLCTDCGESAWLVDPTDAEVAEGLMAIEVTPTATHLHGAVRVPG